MRWLNIQPLTLDRQDICLLVTYTHSPGEEDTICHAGSFGDCTKAWNEPAVAVVGILCSDKRVE